MWWLVFEFELASPSNPNPIRIDSTKPNSNRTHHNNDIESKSTQIKWLCHLNVNVKHVIQGQTKFYAKHWNDFSCCCCCCFSCCSAASVTVTQPPSKQSKNRSSSTRQQHTQQQHLRRTTILFDRHLNSFNYYPWIYFAFIFDTVGVCCIAISCYKVLS